MADSINFLHVDMSKIPKTGTLPDGTVIERLRKPEISYVVDKNGDCLSTIIMHSRVGPK